MAELRQHGDETLAGFLTNSGIALSDVLRRGDFSWTQLRREAGLPVPSGSELEEALLRRVRAFAHVDDPDRAAAYKRILSDAAPAHADLDPADQAFARMLVYSLWNDGGGHPDIDAGLLALRDEAAVRKEISAVVDISFGAARHVSVALGGALAGMPLRIHARYQVSEILPALGSTRSPKGFQTGVLHVPEAGIDALFVTLKKSESDYSPTTMYRDFPISPWLFHWETQSATSVSSATGQRYLSGSSTVLLFVRHERKDEFGTSPYVFLGPVHYVSHTGDRPIAITWRLERPMPTDLFSLATALAQ